MHKPDDFKVTVTPEREQIVKRLMDEYRSELIVCWDFERKGQREYSAIDDKKSPYFDTDRNVFIRLEFTLPDWQVDCDADVQALVTGIENQLLDHKRTAQEKHIADLESAADKLNDDLASAKAKLAEMNKTP